MKLAKNQQGMTLIGWMLVIVLAGFLAIFFIKLVPVYIENFTVRSILEGMKNDAGASYGTVGEVREGIERRFSMNSVNNVQPTDVLVENTGDGFSLTLDYEVRVPFVYNVDLVVSFSEGAQVPQR